MVIPLSFLTLLSSLSLLLLLLLLLSVYPKEGATQKAQGLYKVPPQHIYNILHTRTVQQKQRLQQKYTRLIAN